MKKNYLLTPGPSPVPPKVLLSMAQPIIHHRTPQYKKILSEVNEGLRYLFKTENDIFLFAASGTGAMEATVSNLTSPGDKAIVVKGGKFGERFAEICNAYKVEVIPIEVEWGKAVEPSLIEETLKNNKDTKAVFTTLCETSTAVSTDIKTIAAIVKKYDSLLVVDAISALAAVDFETDAWSVDVVVAGSQKAFMLPPGLSFVSVSQKAWKQVKEAKNPRYYFDFLKAKKSLEKQDTPFTSSVTLVVALKNSLQMIKSEGLDKVLARSKKLARATRQAAEALGLELLAKESPSDAVTAIKLPENIDGENLVKLMRDKYAVSIAGGQGPLKGKIVRIAHFGYINETDIIKGISCLEAALKEMGYKIDLGQGVSAAKKSLFK